MTINRTNGKIINILLQQEILYGQMPRQLSAKKTKAMEQITGNLVCEKNKIRALYCKEYSRSEIAEFLKTAKQRVSKVLINSGYEDAEVRPSNSNQTPRFQKLPPSSSLSIQHSDDKGTTMGRIVEGISTTAEKIQALYQRGYSRTEIKDFLGIRYQYVRNVLVRKGYLDTQLKSSVYKKAANEQQKMKIPEGLWVTIGPAGRIVIPAEIRKHLGVQEGDDVLLNCEEDSLSIVSGDTFLKKLRKKLINNIPEGVSLADELIADRRREAMNEEQTMESFDYE